MDRRLLALSLLLLLLLNLHFIVTDLLIENKHKDQSQPRRSLKVDGLLHLALCNLDVLIQLVERFVAIIIHKLQIGLIDSIKKREQSVPLLHRVFSRQSQTNDLSRFRALTRLPDEGHVLKLQFTLV